MARKTRVKKKRVRLSTDEGLVFVHSSFNNTIISLTDRSGNVLAWSSGGKIGYKGSRKSTPFAAQMAATEVAKIGMEMGIQKVGVIVKGPGGGRESSIRAINAAGIKVT
ncbi:MAG: 30S ribosomal protein S11, partial [Candidatus Cloacimonetes bacterium]|nr:30S ribosomal protein S11 [Candidatus Cloacimonadota bacterium]